MPSASEFPTRVLAGITVPDTPLINSSIALARSALPDHGYNHVMRSWLNGQAIIDKLPEVERSKVDQEAFAVAVILHDLGWSENPEYISKDKRFEVDGAIAARTFLQAETKGDPSWTPARIQLVWDAIALHSTPSIAMHKESEVALVNGGITIELAGPTMSKMLLGSVTTPSQEEWDKIVAEFPNKGLKGYINGLMVHYCTTKPETTYDNFVGDYGEELVEGYERKGHRLFDLFDKTLQD